MMQKLPIRPEPDGESTIAESGGQPYGWRIIVRDDDQVIVIVNAESLVRCAYAGRKRLCLDSVQGKYFVNAGD